MLMQRIDDVHKRKPVEVCITGINCLDSVFPHQHSGMGIENEIATDVRYL